MFLWLPVSCFPFCVLKKAILEEITTSYLWKNEVLPSVPYSNFENLYKRLKAENVASWNRKRIKRIISLVSLQRNRISHSFLSTRRTMHMLWNREFNVSCLCNIGRNSSITPHLHIWNLTTRYWKQYTSSQYCMLLWLISDAWGESGIKSQRQILHQKMKGKTVSFLLQMISKLNKSCLHSLLLIATDQLLRVTVHSFHSQLKEVSTWLFYSP